MEKLPSIRLLGASDLETLCADDERLMRQSMEANCAAAETPLVALIPNIETIRWHHARENFVGEKLHGASPTIKGAMVETEAGKRMWCYWTRMWYNEDPNQRKENTLHILRLVVEDKGIVEWERSDFSEQRSYRLGIAALLAAATEQAKEWGMEAVEIWNPNATTVEAAKMVHNASQLEERDEESICSLRWHGMEDERVVWLGNEKFGWC